MKTFTIKDIRSWNPCYDPKKYLKPRWKGTVLDMLDDKRIPFEDRLWCICRTDLLSEKLMRLFAVWCARQVQHLMKDPRSITCLDVCERFANGLATEEERDAARDDAWAVARAAARAAARDAAWAAAWAAARDAARAARDAALAVRVAQEIKLKELILVGIKTGDVL